MNPVKACRCCLATAGRLERLSDLMMKVFYNICGLKVKPGDGQPLHVCVECKVQLRKALAIRRKSRRAHFVLTQILTTKKIITEEDIPRAIRYSAQLVSSYGPWQPDTSAVYSFSQNEGEIQSKDENDKTKELLQSFGFKAEGGTIGLSATQNTDTGKLAIVQKRSPEVCNNSAILVNVKPDNYEELDRIEEEKIKQRKREEEEALRQIHEEEDRPIDLEEHPIDLEEHPIDLEEHPIDLEDDTFHDHDAGNENTSGIDLTDIFKDLPPEPASDYSLSEPEDYVICPNSPVKRIKERKNHSKSPKGRKEQIKERKKRKKSSEVIVKKATPLADVYNGELKEIIRFCKIYASNDRLLHLMSLSKIRYLSIEGQINCFENRKEQEVYKMAYFRCSMCVKAFGSRDALFEHMKANHTAITQIKCAVCCGRFHTIEDLEVHQGWDHWYEYNCICGRTKYTFEEFVLCCASHLYRSEIPLVKDKMDLEEFFMPRFEKVPLTPDRWHESKWDTNLTCTRCGLVFNNKIKQKLHMKKEQRLSTPRTDVRKHKCDVCGLVLKSRTAMEYHFDTCHAYLYRCKGCQLIFTRSTALSHKNPKCHYKKVKSKAIEVNYHCVICGDCETTKALLYKHQLSTHRMIVVNSEGLGDGQYLCCKTYFTNESAYHTHLLNAGHDAAKHIPLACVPCKVRFADEAEMRDHVHITPTPALDELPNDKRVKCRWCPRMFETQIKMQRHFHSYHSHWSQPTICEICGKNMTRQWYSRHIKTHEKTSSEFECQYCTAKTKFDVAGRFASHMLRHHTPYPYICSICNRRFLNKYRCKRHITNVCHAPKKMLECIACSKHFTSSEKLYEHLINLHQINVSKVPARTGPIGALHFALTCYPHMRLDGSGIPIEVIKRSGLLLDAYDGETRIELPPEKIVDYFIYDESTVIGEVPNKQKYDTSTVEQSKAKCFRARRRYNERRRERRKILKNQLRSKLDQHQQLQENKMAADDNMKEEEEGEIKHEIVVSYVRNEDGEFVKLKSIQGDNAVKDNINIEKGTVEAPNIDSTDSNHLKRKQKSQDLDEVSKKRVKNKQTFVGTKTKPQTGKSLGIIDGIGDIVEEIAEKTENNVSKFSFSQLSESSGLCKEGNYEGGVVSSDIGGLSESNEIELINSEFNTSGLRIGEENISGLGTSGSKTVDGLKEEGEHIRIEVDAEEFAENYEIVELDGVEYAHINGILYKLEYS